MAKPNYNIAMFAYNEERNIVKSIENIYANIDDNLGNFFLLANGCTDNTVAIAKQIKQRLAFEKLTVIDIPIGDKCNAWNHYVYTLAQDEMCHFFVDADVTFSKNCFTLMFDKLVNCQPTPNIVAGYPLSGRNLAFYQHLVEQRFCFFGNLYAASGQYLSMVKEKQFTLPIGLNWIDSFLTKAANTDISFESNNRPGRVVYLKNVGFEFESLSPFRKDDILLYKNRIARYELGKIQERYLDQMAFTQWPEDMREINLKIRDDFDSDTRELGFVKKFLVKKRLNKLLEPKG
jgi:glycosyltransferase involved in cell wall biosynthesis